MPQLHEKVFEINSIEDTCQILAPDSPTTFLLTNNNEGKSISFLLAQ